jgi:hypothetical protein
MPGSRQLSRLNFTDVARDMCGPSVRNLLHATPLAPRILRRPLDFWKELFTPILY